MSVVAAGVLAAQPAADPAAALTAGIETRRLLYRASLTLRMQQLLGAVTEEQRKSQMANLAARWSLQGPSAAEREQWRAQFDTASASFFAFLESVSRRSSVAGRALPVLREARTDLAFQQAANGDMARPLTAAISIMDWGRPVAVHGGAFQGVNQEIESLMTAAAGAISLRAPVKNPSGSNAEPMPMLPGSIPGGGNATTIFDELVRTPIPSGVTTVTTPGGSVTTTNPPRAGAASGTPAADVLGSVWRETEAGYAGVWTRRGNSSTFDADWSGHKSVLQITVSGRNVAVSRRDPSGLTCQYRGELAADGRSVRGTMSCDQNGVVGQAWNATIEGAGTGPISSAGGIPGGPVGANLALRKPTRTSSRSPWSTPTEGGAVDGAITGEFGFHTNYEANPWWEVDLQQVYPIGEVRIFNRRSSPERARTLQIHLSSDGSRWDTAYRHNGTIFGADGQPLRVELKGVAARWVRISLQATEYLHLDEVEIYGAEPSGSAIPVITRRPDYVSEPQPRDVLGSVWNEVEAGYVGVWTRRGNSNTFDADWSGHKSVLQITVNGRNVTVSRRDPSGLTCQYRGELAADGRTVRGTMSCDQNGVVGQTWNATIRQ